MATTYGYIKRDPRYRVNPSKDFNIVYRPAEPIYGRYRRFFVGFNTLVKYVGQNNAFTALERALNSGRDKYRVQLRKYGTIDFYRI